MDTYRVGLISDIHANEVALEAVLKDIETSGVDEIACLGDVGTLGPRPVEVLQRVRDVCAHFILGNHDEFLIRPQLLQDYTDAPPVVAAVEWCENQISHADRAFVATFQERSQLSLGGAGSLLLFHGTPESNTTDLLSDTSGEQLDEWFRPYPAAVMVGGHTHVQMLRQHRGALIVNPGSVGLPFREYVAGRRPTIMAYAEYALLEARGKTLSISLRRVAVDERKLLAEAQSWDQPLGRDLAEQYARAHAGA